MSDPVNHPPHYTSHPSGVECIQITEHMNFCLGNAIKYLWRADMKNGLEDLEKANWYINREIERRKAEELANEIKQSLSRSPLMARLKSSVGEEVDAQASSGR